MRRRVTGFTLIELMIVVAIIGSLASLAIPSFLKFQLRAKTSEAKTNLLGIRAAEESHFAEVGQYVAAASHPGPPGSQRRRWTLPAAGFDTIGWTPEGDVYFMYTVVSPSSTEWAASAVGNLDGDGNPSAFGYVHPTPGNPAVSAAPPNCNATGVYNAANPLAFDLLNSVGPCEQFSGQSWF